MSAALQILKQDRGRLAIKWLELVHIRIAARSGLAAGVLIQLIVEAAQQLLAIDADAGDIGHRELAKTARQLFSVNAAIGMLEQIKREPVI